LADDESAHATVCAVDDPCASSPPAHDRPPRHISTLALAALGRVLQRPADRAARASAPARNAEASAPTSRHLFVFAEQSVPADFAERVAAAVAASRRRFRVWDRRVQGPAPKPRRASRLGRRSPRVNQDVAL
jgi:hypothetical protein